MKSKKCYQSTPLLTAVDTLLFNVPASTKWVFAKPHTYTPNCHTSSSSGNSLTYVGLPQLYTSLPRTVMLKAICGCSHLLQQFKQFWWKPAPRQRLHKCWNTEIQKTHHRLYTNFWKSNLLGSNTHYCPLRKPKTWFFFFVLGVKYSKKTHAIQNVMS